MGADSRGYTLDISEPLFRLTTESLRLHSNETKRYQTLEDLVNSRVPGIEKIDDEDAKNLKQHLVTLPTDGAIRIHLSITETSAENLERIQQLLEKRLATDISVSDALSALLFDYLVEQKTARVIAKLELDEFDQPRTNGSANGVHS
ncbi:hypothetical protein [Sphingobium sp. D43FB]|uniref:hypothetical protein n=1 Tax=Sphingobium sp. D43FB TaxID=2017595 RepID=UPI000BB55A70|nr:hypothetical protein [Sphingobium sp. D43FB]PBN42289.1 hypothetical protein SxD43FB_17360 [Sphingobium sp. D43FB]